MLNKKAPPRTMGDKNFPSIFGSASALRAVEPKGRGPAEGEVVAQARLIARLGEGLVGYHFRGDLNGEAVSVHVLGDGVTAERRAKFQAAVDELLSLSRDDLAAGVLTPLSVNHERTAITLPVTPERCLEDLGRDGLEVAPGLETIAALAVALEALHDRDLAHGALSPSAVYLDDAGGPVVAGSSGMCLFLGTVNDSVEPQAFHTYASPEAKEGRGIDARSDIFSLGKLLHFMLLGAHPPGSDADRPRLETLADSPRGLVRIVRKCTRRRPEDRYPNVESLLADLVHNDDADVGSRPAEGEDEPPLGKRVVLPKRFDRQAERRALIDAREAAKAGTANERALEKARASAEVELGIRTAPGKKNVRLGFGVLGTILFAGAFAAPFVAHPAGSQLAPAAAVIGAALATFLVRGRGAHGAYYELAAAALAAVVVFGADPSSVSVRAAAEARLAQDDPAIREAAARFLAARGHRTFVDIDLQGAALDRLSLDGANFDGANLRGATLTGSDLRRANLYGADVSGADFSGADLTGAELMNVESQRSARCDALTRPPTGWRCLGDRLTARDQ